MGTFDLKLHRHIMSYFYNATSLSTGLAYIMQHGSSTGGRGIARGLLITVY